MPRPRDGRAHEKTAECKNRMKNWGEGEKLRRVFLLRVNTALRITVGERRGGRSLETTGETSDLEGGRRWPAVAGIRDFRQALRWGGEGDGGQHRGFWSEAGPTERLHCSRRLIHCRSPHPAANRLSPLAPPFFDPLPPHRLAPFPSFRMSPRNLIGRGIEWWVNRCRFFAAGCF